RERLRVESGKALRNAESEIFVDHALDVAERERLDVVLQAPQCFEVGRRQQIGARGEQLPEFDERRAEALEVGRQFVRLAVVGFSERLVGNRFVEPGALYQIGFAVLIKESADIFVTTQPVRME